MTWLTVFNLVKKALLIFCYFGLGLLALALILATLIPLLHSDQWWIRIFDFPRIQFVVLMVFTLICYTLLRFWRGLTKGEYGLVMSVVVALVWQLIAIAPYTVIYPKEMADSTADSGANRISLLVYNVLYNNRDVAALRALIQQNNPDVILLSEPTPWWMAQLAGLEDEYPFTMRQPQDNKYGMLLYSKLELIKPEIRFLIEPHIPSLRTRVKLRSGAKIILYGVHPRPPGLRRHDQQHADNNASNREDSDKRDAELMVIAKEVKKNAQAPVIVAGDFNDVAWSRSTHLFQRVGGLLDPRVGRGVFNTYDARSRLLRYPLDHAFASEHFLLVELKRLANIGSDHFPFLIVLQYDANAAVANDEPLIEAGDEQKADKAISKGKNTPDIKE